MKISRDWLQSYFAEPLPQTTKLVEGLTMHAFEIEGVEKAGKDEVLDVKVLPNRAHDCLSHHGIAKEVAAIFNTPLSKKPLEAAPVFAPITDELSISVESKKAERFSAALLKNVVVSDSPKWLKERLEALGQKSINNIVDATNYVMFDLGQPLHAFDADKIHGGIVVRDSKAGEKVTALDGKAYDLPEETILITASEKILGIAGIKGGQEAEITGATKNIILEAANFNAETVRRSSKLLRLRTDASVRFENGISPELPGYALRAVIDLILEIASGTLIGFKEHYPNPPEASSVEVSLEDINGILGTKLGEDEVEAILQRLDFPYEKISGGYSVIAPFERLDMRIKEDVVEEIGRIYGLENIPSEFKKSEAPVEIQKNFYYCEKIRQILKGWGFSEVSTYAMTNYGDLKIENPIAEDKAFLRRTISGDYVGNTTAGKTGVTFLEGGMAKAFLENKLRNSLSKLVPVKMFEIGTVWPMGREELSLCLAVEQLKKDEKTAVDYLNDLNQLLGVNLQGVSEGTQIVDTKGNLKEVFENLPDPAKYEKIEISNSWYKAPSQFPFILRDISIWIPKETNVMSVADLIHQLGGELLRKTPYQADEFSKDNKKSVTFRLVFQSDTKTLTDDEVNKIMEKVTFELNNHDGFKVR